MKGVIFQLLSKKDKILDFKTIHTYFSKKGRAQTLLEFFIQKITALKFRLTAFCLKLATKHGYGVWRV